MSFRIQSAMLARMVHKRIMSITVPLDMVHAGSRLLFKANHLQLSALHVLDFHNHRLQLCRLSRSGIEMQRINLCMPHDHSMIRHNHSHNVCCNFVHWFIPILSLRLCLALAFGWRWLYLSNLPRLAKPRCLVCQGNIMAENHLFFQSSDTQHLSTPSGPLIIKDHECAEGPLRFSTCLVL